MPRTSLSRVAAPPLDERLMVERRAATCCFAFSWWRLARSKRRRGRRERRRRACAADCRRDPRPRTFRRWLAGLALRSASFLFVRHRHSRRRQLARSSVRPSVRACVRASHSSIASRLRFAFDSDVSEIARSRHFGEFISRPSRVPSAPFRILAPRVRRPCAKPVQFRPRQQPSRSAVELAATRTSGMFADRLSPSARYVKDTTYRDGCGRAAARLASANLGDRPASRRFSRSAAEASAVALTFDRNESDRPNRFESIRYVSPRKKSVSTYRSYLYLRPTGRIIAAEPPLAVRISPDFSGKVRPRIRRNVSEIRP